MSVRVCARIASETLPTAREIVYFGKPTDTIQDIPQFLRTIFHYSPSSTAAAGASQVHGMVTVVSSQEPLVLPTDNDSNMGLGAQTAPSPQQDNVLEHGVGNDNQQERVDEGAGQAWRPTRIRLERLPDNLAAMFKQRSVITPTPPLHKKVRFADEPSFINSSNLPTDTSETDSSEDELDAGTSR